MYWPKHATTPLTAVLPLNGIGPVQASPFEFTTKPLQRSTRAVSVFPSVDVCEVMLRLAAPSISANVGHILEFGSSISVKMVHRVPSAQSVTPGRSCHMTPGRGRSRPTARPAASIVARATNYPRKRHNCHVK